MSDTLEIVNYSPPPPRLPYPAISVIIPLYNAEDYVGECLDSLLLQTFQNFEVIVVDDCSTDNSVAVVESYAPKFNGRLRLEKTEKNSGGGGYVPRNIGLSFASGEYVWFVDADDFILLTALETLYNAAKEYVADIVYMGSYYEMINPNDIYIHRDGEGKKLIREGIEDKPDLRIDDPNKNLRLLLLEEPEGNLRNPWSKFMRRDFLIANKIFFPAQMTTGGDFIWVINVYCHAKRFLRLPARIYFYRNNTSSVTKTKRKPAEQISYWISAFIDFVKNLSALENENEVLQENPAYCFSAFKSHFEWCLVCTRYARDELSDKDIYEALHQKFVKNFSAAISDERNIDNDFLKQYDELKREVTGLKNSPLPAISVIIPLYNAEKYVGECLDSLLLQTFQDFEVIVVDDCSTDNSVAVVESYAPKFNGRLKIFHMEKNTGSGALPRNKGLSCSNGEYVFFMDADDFILLSSLEILYTAAKEYDAEVVYSSSHYDMRAPNDVFIHQDGEGKKLLREGLEDKPKLRIDDQNGNLRQLLLEEREGNFRTPCTKLIQRDFLLKNRIFFPQIPISEDFIWVIDIYCNAKRFLRISKPFYIYRNNISSVTKLKRKPSEQISKWISAFVDFLKALKKLENKNKILSENPDYCLATLKNHFEWCFTCIKYAREKMSSSDIYETLYHEFVKKSSDSTVPFFFSFIDNERKTGDERLKTIKKLEKDVSQLKASSVLAVSVIIPMYNAEKYVGKCLDSLLAQTFQNFEVIVVDDCSKDKSFQIVKSYAPKFKGRLTVTKLEKNSGSGALPRNKGLSLSRGEYIQFLDADDKLTKTALNEMYTLAKDYDADVVNCEKFYEVNSVGENTKIKSYQKGDFVKKPTLEPENLAERVQRIVNDGYLTVPWSKLIKRNLIMDNEIFFPAVKISEDNIWNQGLLFCAKKFLRVPNIVYIYRLSETSIQKTNQTKPQQTINFWLNPVLLGLKALDNMMNRHEFFKVNPSCRFAILKKFIETRFAWTLNSARKLGDDVIYSTIKDKFGERLGEYDVLIPALCATLYTVYNEAYTDAETLREFINYFTSETAPQSFTARIDLKLAKQGDFKIVSMSDNKAEVSKPDWFQKDGTGYIIQSNVGKLELVAKAAVDGQIQLNLKGISVYSSKDKTQRIPQWIGYTKFVVNGKAIFDKLTPAWHDKPYFYNMNAKAGEEIKIGVEWLQNKFHDDKKSLDSDAEVIRKFKDHFTARVDLTLKKETEQGGFKIVSVSDDKASVRKAGWTKKNEVGYFVQSYNGKMEIVAKPTADGQIQLDLRGLDVRNPENKSKRIPYWIDYTKLAVNGKTLFDKLTPIWHDKPFRYNLDVKADEEIKIEVEWQPHRDDSLKVSTDAEDLREKSAAKDMLINKLQVTLDNEKKAADKQKVLIAELQAALDNEKKIHSGDVDLLRNFSDYFTARVDLTLKKATEQGGFKIVSVSDDKATVRKNGWAKKNEVGYFVQSYCGKMEIVAKPTADGQIALDLRGLDVRNPENKSKRIPYWIDYTKLVVNGEILFEELLPVWHNKPYKHTIDAKADEEIKIEVEWLPHRSDT